MHINKFDGSLSFDGGSIQRSMDKSSFLASPLGAKAEQWAVNGGLETYRFIPEPGIVATTSFQDGRLLQVSITFDLPDDAPDNRSMRHELVRKEKHDEWLRLELDQPPYRYNWGHVSSEFYHQHCESEMTVVYEPNHAG